MHDYRYLSFGGIWATAKIRINFKLLKCCTVSLSVYETVLVPADPISYDRS